jgi:hypothetical protein
MERELKPEREMGLEIGRYNRWGRRRKREQEGDQEINEC